MQVSSKRIAKNTAFLYTRMLVSMFIGFFTSRIILQALGAEDYGIYNVVGGVVSIMSFLNGALSASTSRFLTYELGKGDSKKLKNTFSASLTLHCGVALLVLILGETLGLWFFYEKMVVPEERLNAAFWVYQFSIVTTMVSFTQVPYNASLIAHENMSVYAYVGLYDAISKLLISLAIMVSPMDNLVFYAMLLMINTCGVQLFYRFYTAKKYEECHLHIVHDKSLYKTLLNYSGWDMFGGIAVVCQGQGINILLNIFFGPIVNAARGIAVTVQGVTMTFVGNFLTAVRPQVVKNYAEGDTRTMFYLTFNAAKFAYILMLALVLPICFEVRFVLDLWLGDGVPEETYIFVILILITYLMETYHLASLMPYHAIGRIELGNLVGGTLMILSLPFSYIALKLGAPSYSVYIVIFFVNLTQTFWGWIIVHRYEKFSYLKLIKDVYSPTIIITCISVAVAMVCYKSMADGWMRLIVLTLSTEVTILVSTCILALNAEERVKVMSIIKKRVSKEKDN